MLQCSIFVPAHDGGHGAPRLPGERLHDSDEFDRGVSMTQEFVEIFSVGERNFDDALERAGAVAKTCAALASENAANCAKALGDGAALAGALWSVRDWREAADLQADYARKAYEDYASSAARMGALWIDLIKEASPRFDR
jgi:hypothetical protein